MEHLTPAVDVLHKKAMELAEEAFYAKRADKFAVAQDKLLLAFEYEHAAAMLLIGAYSQEPSRSVLFRSAGCLLLDLPFPTKLHLRQAERMFAFGLVGNPPVEIAEELRTAWKDLINRFQKEVA